MFLAYEKVIQLKNAIEIMQERKNISKTQEQQIINQVNRCFEIIERRKVGRGAYERRS